MIYLDNAATTSLSKIALDTFLEVSQNTFGNPSSTHHFGRKASQILRHARQSIADVLHVSSEQIIFTSGGSEANNLAIKGYCLANQAKGKHLITTAIEHHSVLHTMEYLEKRYGFEVTYIKPRNQAITAQQIADALRPDTILVSTMYANNETGMILPIQEIGQILASHQAVFHVDAVQVVGKIPLNLQNIDFLSASAHKFHGPKGVGFLYSCIKNMDSLIHGGRQEQQYRAGTENYAGIASMAAALVEQETNLVEDTLHIEKIKERLLNGLADQDIYLNETNPSLPHILSIGFPNRLNEQLLMKLDLAGFAVSSGSACTAGTIQKSHVLEALYGTNSPRLTESIRISFSKETTFDEIDQLVSYLKTI